MTTQPYRIRPGYHSDVPHATDIYMQAFSKDHLMDILFPTRYEHPGAHRGFVSRIFYSRWWNPNYDLRVLAGAEDDVPVAFTWWKRPNSELTFYERWVSPTAWINPIIQAYFSVRDWLFPVPNLDDHASNTFFRVFKDIESDIINTPRRKSAWYLSTLATRPHLQGKGLGTMMLQSGLQRVDERGAAAWLVGVSGIEEYYGRHGFVEVARANIGELKDWEGGSVMFRND